MAALFGSGSWVLTFPLNLTRTRMQIDPAEGTSLPKYSHHIRPFQLKRTAASSICWSERGSGECGGRASEVLWVTASVELWVNMYIEEC